MAAVSITATQVLPSTGADIRMGTVGAATTVVAGSMVYAHTDGTLLLTSAQTTALTAAAVGMCLNGGSAGQVVRYVASDPALQMGTAASLTAGTVLYLDDGVAGGLITTFAELDSGDFVTTVGIVTAATLGVVNFKITASGVAKA